MHSSFPLPDGCPTPGDWGPTPSLTPIPSEPHLPWCPVTQWASLSQKDPALWHPCCGGSTFVVPEARCEAEKAAAQAYEASRTVEEKEGFNKALHETMDLWYAHQGTTVYMLTNLPEGCTRKVGYEDSGWTTYERCSAEQIKRV
jgi:hypothetical protein